MVSSVLLRRSVCGRSGRATGPRTGRAGRAPGAARRCWSDDLAPTGALLGDQTRSFEHGDVLLHGREAHGVVPGQFSDASLPASARRTMSRRVPSARAAKIWSALNASCIDTTIWLYQHSMSSFESFFFFFSATPIVCRASQREPERKGSRMRRTSSIFSGGGDRDRVCEPNGGDPGTSEPISVATFDRSARVRPQPRPVRHVPMPPES